MRAWFYAEHASAGRGEVAVIYRNSAGTALATTQGFVNLVQGQWVSAQVTASAVAPALTVYVDFRMSYEASGTGARSCYMDDAMGVLGTSIDDTTSLFEDVFTPGDWVDVPVFYGPVSRYARDGHEVTLEAVGKEALLFPPVKQNYGDIPDPADKKLATYLRNQATAFGEEKLRLVEGAGTTVPKNFTLNMPKVRENGLWWYLKLLASTRNFRLFYGPDGYLELRPLNPSQATYTFRDVMDEPTVAYDLTMVRNRIEVYDQDKQGDPEPLVRADLPESHPLSAASLARNGVPRVLLERLDFEDVRMSVAEATKLAKDALEQKSVGSVDVQFTSLPVPHVQLGDKVRVLTDTVDEVFQLRRFTLPLTANDTMSVGFTKPVGVRVNRNKIRTRRI
jgi:hypothetical protein